MSATWVIKHLDVIEDISASSFPIPVDFPFHPFALEQREEAFGNSIVVTVSTPTHARFQPMIFQEVPPFPAGVLRALIGVNQNLLLGPALPGGHQQRVHDQIGRHSWLHGPANNFPRKQIQNGGEIQVADCLHSAGGSNSGAREGHCVPRAVFGLVGVLGIFPLKKT